MNSILCIIDSLSVMMSFLVCFSLRFELVLSIDTRSMDMFASGFASLIILTMVVLCIQLYLLCL